ncbi:MAG: HIT domain-containing protein, partial [Sulfurimonas sp.]|nr:HIT domain-containing protein [Sulfurimonas sp.]
EHCFIVMNRYPYTPGHFMIIPHLHTDKLVELPSQTWLHISDLAQKSVRLLKEGFGAKGINIGMNLGEVAGAGIAEHIHMHLVPRWDRDTNFITSIGHNRVYSTDFEKIYKKIKLLIPKYIK